MTHDYTTPRDAYIHSGPIPPPTMWPMGEIQHDDGTIQLIPQPVRWEPTQVDATTVVLRPVPRTDALTVTGVMRAVEKGPSSVVERPSRVPRVPVWSLASIVSGAVLMAIGWLMNDPVARMVFEAIPR